MVVNYTYLYRKSLEPYQKTLLSYSILKSKEFAKVHFHCNKEFLPILEEVGKVDKVFLIEENPNINYKTFWAASKIEVYNKCPIGQIHLDIDAVIKDHEYFNEDVVVAYYDKTDPKPTVFELPTNYTLPSFITPDTDGFNMSYVLFNIKELKDLYCKLSLEYILNNNIEDNTWKSMVFAEQAFLTQIVYNEGYSYKYFANSDNYYHLGAAKHYLNEEDKTSLINKLENKIYGDKIFC